ncbi:MAG: GNAT family N-acetyltransferase [Deinococcota bacterium]
MADITLRNFETSNKADKTAVITLWNAYLERDHPLTMRLLEQSLEAHTVADWFVLAVAAGEVVGFVWAKPAGWWASTTTKAHLCGLAVVPAHCHQGIGSTLWKTLVTRLSAAGIQHFRIAAEPKHLLAGIPQVASQDTWRFLQARGVTWGGLEHDLLVDLRHIPDTNLAEGYQLIPITHDHPQGEHLLALMAQEFPGRWQAEVSERVERGLTVLALMQEQPQLSLVGFACVFLADDATRHGYLGPSLNWAMSLSKEMMATTAGLGPIGMAASQRGKGLGLGLLTACLDYLKTQGTTHTIIDWTDLVTFYARVGARVWRSYQSAQLEL